MSERILGQDRAMALLSADLASGRLAGSYLFAGPQGVGKKAAALELAKAVNCKGPQTEDGSADDLLIPGFGDPPAPAAPERLWGCGVCNSCRKIGAGTHSEVFILDFDSQAALLGLDDEKRLRQKEYRVDAVRLLINRSFLTSFEAAKKVFIIDGAEQLNEESANALLKVLEEPTQHCLWILLASGSDRVLATIRSRCRRVHFGLLSERDVVGILARRKREDPKAFSDGEDLEEVARLCDGSMAGASALLDGDLSELEALAGEVLDLASATRSQRLRPALEASSGIIAESRRTSAKAHAGRFLKILSLKMAQRLRREPHWEGAQDLLSVLQSQDELRRNVNPQLVLDSLLLNFSATREGQ